MSPEATISQFLQEAFTDDSLLKLREDAVAGKVPWDNCSDCLVGHADIENAYDYFDWSEASQRASDAYAVLYHGSGSPASLTADMERIRRLIPLIDAEISRRSAARAEVVERAKEVVIQSPAGILSVSR